MITDGNTNTVSTRDWRNAQPAFEPPARCTTPAPRRTASIDVWRSSPAVLEEKRRSFVAGFISAMLFYGIVSALLVAAFVYLGFRP